MKNILFKIIGLSLLVTSNSFAAFSLPKTIAAQLTLGDYENAFTELSAMNPELQGEFEYDWGLAQAAFYSGRYTDAIFALERVVAIQETKVDAHVLLAKSYQELNEYDSAKQQLNTALKLNLEPAEVLKITKLLETFKGGRLTSKDSLSLWAELGIGYSDNINNATDNISIFVPASAATAILSGNSLEQSAALTQLSAGFKYRKTLNENTQSVTKIKFSTKVFEGKSEFNQSLLLASTGLSKPLLNGLIEFGVNTNLHTIDSSLYKKAFGLYSQWMTTMADNNQLNLNIRLGQSKFPSQSVRDATYVSLGGGISKALHSRYSPRFKLAAYVGSEINDEVNGKHLGYNFASLVSQAEMTFSGDTKALASVYVQQRHYHANDPQFLVNRKDQQMGVQVKAEYKLDNKFTFIPKLQFSKNSSNIQVNEYQSLLGMVSIRRQFK